MKENRTIVVASKNKGKINEIIEFFKSFPIQIKTLDDFGEIPVVDEDGLTFADNAYKKSSFTARVLGFPAISDDSGLVVPALGGEPGVYSSRYAGNGATDLENCNKLLRELKFHTNRKAYFECSISIAVPGGNALTYEGRCYGSINKDMIGKNGFGYDALFLCDKFNKTFAQLSMGEKNIISHRGAAFKVLINEFDKVLSWLDLQIPIKSATSCYGKDN